MKSYIPPILIRELKEIFPDRLPTEREYHDGKATPERVAFLAGIQHCVHYLEQSAKAQDEI